MGIVYSGISQNFPPRPRWGVHDMPDLTGKTALVTGGYTGIGKWTAKALLDRNARVYIAGRDETKGSEALLWLKTQTGKDAHFLQLDLANLKAVKASAEQYIGREKELHLLFNNAGVMFAPIDQLTSDGYDLQFGTNVVGPFLFTKLLLPALIAGVKTSPDGHSRIITTASYAADGGTVDFNALRDSPARKRKGTNGLYLQSKLGNVLVSNELAKRYGAEGVVSCAVNPGNIHSELQRHTEGIAMFILNRICHDTPFGALTPLYAGTTTQGLALNGKYLWPFAREGWMPDGAKAPKLQQEMWSWLEEQVKNV